jgi:small ubiquitin-related modifier
MKKVFTTYANQRNVKSTSLRFLMDGEVVDWAKTAKDLQLADGDQIDCLLEQCGGRLLLKKCSEE